MAFTAKTAKQLREESGSLLSKIASENSLIDAELDIVEAMLGAGYGTIRLGAGSAIPNTTNGADEGAPTETSTNKVMYQHMDFDKDTQQSVQWGFSMPKDYDGSTITAKVKWGSAGAGDVIWGVKGACVLDGEVLDVAFGTAKEVTDTLITTTKLQVSAATAAITIAGTPAADAFTIIQLYRKAAAAGDTLDADAIFYELVLTYGKKTS